jgi:hypothetical protein
MASEKCDHCDYNEATGFNYCRKCGFHIHAGQIHTRLAIARTKTDKFCGNCGKKVRHCNCGLPSK